MMLRLEFEEPCIKEIAKKAIERKTGARGLRSIIEGIMLTLCLTFHHVMILQNVLLPKETVTENREPKLVLEDGTVIEEERKTSA